MKKYTVVILGSRDIGKTSLVRRFVDGVFTEGPDSFHDEPPTGHWVPLRRLVTTATVDLDGQRVDLEIHDPLDGRYILGSKYYQMADAVILAYDLTERDSFGCAFGYSCEGHSYSRRHCAYFMVGTKSDLKGEREITEEETREQLERQNAPSFGKHPMDGYFECSALTGENVDLLFKTIAQKCECAARRLQGGDYSADASRISGVALTPPSTNSHIKPTKATKCECFLI